MAGEEEVSKLNLAGSTELRCTTCGVVEQVIPLDGKPVDELFAANYLCHECDEISDTMREAARSSLHPDPIPPTSRKRSNC
jgi:hypothetical protein